MDFVGVGSCVAMVVGPAAAVLAEWRVRRMKKLVGKLRYLLHHRLVVTVGPGPKPGLPAFDLNLDVAVLLQQGEPDLQLTGGPDWAVWVMPPTWQQPRPAGTGPIYLAPTTTFQAGRAYEVTL